MFLVPIALIIVVFDLVQFIGWVVPSRVCTNGILNGGITKLQCSVFCVKRTMNRVPGYIITSVLSLK